MSTACAAGEAGVARAIEIMRNELDITMALIGVSRIADINRGTIIDGSARQPYEKVQRDS
jgi:isopentenyl diphosphate isomerase/L-lactate dehydrogenase-like FMN-dependent dehydrogenase